MKIDRALETMEQSAQVAGPGEQFEWTIPGWPMHARPMRVEKYQKSSDLA